VIKIEDMGFEDLDGPVSFVIVYFPRSAGKFLITNYGLLTDTSPVHIHDTECLELPNAISIIRNPLDAVSSAAAINIFEVPSFDVYQNGSSLDFYLTYYMDFAKALLESDVPIFTFEDVTEKFPEVATYLADKFGDTVKLDPNKTVSYRYPGYVLTSKTHEDYDSIKGMIAESPKYNTCLSLYEQVLQKTVKL
jgi:hypothetical protein